MIEPWPTVQSEMLADYRVCRVRRDLKRSPRTGATHDFFVLECPSWVNVIALTSTRQIVLVEQYRHGTATVELEIPGGVMDPGDTSPVETGVRELREETGYVGQRARVIGCVAPNPAIQNNLAYTVLVEDCEPTGAIEFDHTEDLVTRVESLGRIPELIAAGQIRHSLVVAAFHYFHLVRLGQQPEAS
jgi:8-oxo-dGTP pyrophosphatase MutT (NUDIX family)